jgi:hypothetical protein
MRVCLQKFIAQVNEQAANYILAFVIAPGSLGMLWFKKFLETHLYVTALGMIVLFIISCFCGYKLYVSNRKVLMNRIRVDRRGDCYCPNCSRHLDIKVDPSHKAQQHFFCKKCKEGRYPYLETGKYGDAAQFYAFQQRQISEGKKPRIMFVDDYYAMVAAS